MEGISVSCLCLLVLGTASGLLQAAHLGLWVTYGELQAREVRENLFDALLRTDLGWFEKTQDGLAALLARVQTHIRDLQQATSQSLGYTLQNLIAAVASLILALYISWKLALVCLATVPVCAIIMGIVSKKIQPSMQGQDTELTKAAKLADAAISLIDTVKLFNGEASEIRQYASTIHKAAKWYLKEAFICAVEIGCIHLLTFGVFVQGFWYGGYLVSCGELDAGQVLTTFWACFQSAQAIEDIIPQLMILEKGRAAATFLRNMAARLGARNPVQWEPEKLCPKYCEGDIRFRNVTFAYPARPDCYVLNDCSLFFPAGDITFIVGKSGSGKSTIGNLLMRFYEPNSGEISIDGNLLENLDLNWIRNNITLVQQQSTLFNETIIKNISFGSREIEKITEEDVLTSIHFAGLSNTIQNLSRGLDTVVGLHGSFLSGGQRQRVALARSRLRDTPILILDESTSSLDSCSRKAVMAALRSWRRGKTTIVITHDLSQIDEHEFVYVMGSGKVVRKGYRRSIERAISPRSRHLDGRHQAVLTPTREYVREWSSPSLTPGSPFFHRLSAQNRWSMLPSPVEPRMLVSGTSSGRPASAFQYESRLVSQQHDREDKFVEDTAIDANKISKSQPETFAPYFTIIRSVILSLGIRERIFLCLGFLCAICHAAATPVFSYLFSRLLGTLFLTQDRSQSALKWAFAVLGISVANGIASFGMHYLLELCGQEWVDHLRYEAMRRILRQSRHWFNKDSSNVSMLVNCLDRSAEEMKNLIGKFAGFLLVATVMIITGTTWSSVVCWKLTLVGVACAPVLYFFTRSFDAVSRKWESRCSQAHDVLAGIFAETFLDIRTIRALTLESYFHRKHNKANLQAFTIGLKRACFTGSLFGLSDSSILFVYSLVFYYGAVLASSLKYSTEEILTVFSMLLFSMVNVKAALALIPQISASRGNATRILELASLPDGVSHEERGTLPVPDSMQIQFKNVSFSYPSRPESLVLQDLNLSIQENTCTAIVGESGSGKSTIASLLLCLYPVDSTAAITGGFSGSISIGGLDIRRIHVPSLRSSIAIVPQHPSIFPTTIRANLIYGLDESSPLNTFSNMAAAARAAGIHDFISTLPLGYDTVVGDGGLGLSGGQLQRLAIARALVRHPRVLILDEATSNLDVESVDLIRRTVEKLMRTRKNMTVIIITHAKEMMEMADRVVVMDRGRVVDHGPLSEMRRRSTSGIVRHLVMD
ncbi:hypothetical protein VTO42DRAFT_1274 [Malbranchea cinnamomea]